MRPPIIAFGWHQTKTSRRPDQKFLSCMVQITGNGRWEGKSFFIEENDRDLVSPSNDTRAGRMYLLLNFSDCKHFTKKMDQSSGVAT